MAAANGRVPDRQHSRWHLENAKDGYVKDNLENRLTVSKTLGLQLLPDCRLCDTTVGYYDSQATVVAQAVVYMGKWDRVCVCVWDMLWE